jgi:hypothetical protein
MDAAAEIGCTADLDAERPHRSVERDPENNS